MGQDISQSTRLGRGVSLLLTYIAITITMTIFRSGSIDSSLHIIGAMFGANGVILPAGLEEAMGPVSETLASMGVLFGEHVPNDLASWATGYEYIVILTLIALFLPNTQEIMRDFKPAFDTYRGKVEMRSPSRPRFAINRRWAVMTALLFTVAVGSLTRVSEFLYFQF